MAKKSKKTKSYTPTKVIIQKYTQEVLRACRCNSKGKPLKDGGIIRVDANNGGMKYLKNYLKNGGVKIVKIVKLKKAPKH